MYKILGIDTAGLKSFSTTELCKIVGVSRPAFQVWSTEYFEPSITKSAGPGQPAAWSIGDLVAIKTFQILIKAGCSRTMAMSCATSLGPIIDKRGGKVDEDFYWIEVYSDGTKLGIFKIVDDREKIGDFDRDGCKLMVAVNVLDVLNELKAAIKKL